MSKTIDFETVIDPVQAYTAIKQRYQHNLDGILKQIEIRAEKEAAIFAAPSSVVAAVGRGSARSCPSTLSFFRISSCSRNAARARCSRIDTGSVRMQASSAASTSPRTRSRSVGSDSRTASRPSSTASSTWPPGATRGG